MIKIDLREPKQLRQFIADQYPDVIQENLLVGDYAINNFLIERKEIADFLQSYQSGKLQRQLFDMKEVQAHKILLITGEYDEYLISCNMNKISAVPYNSFIKMVLRISFDFPYISIIQLNNHLKLIDLIGYMLNYEGKEINFSDIFKHSQKTATKSDIRTAMLSCIPGISWNKAKQILNKVKWNDLIDEDWDLIEEELKELNGIGPKTIKAIYDNLRN